MRTFLLLVCHFPDTYIQKAKKNYQDSRARRSMNRLNDELQDVQRIMVQNIDDVLQRGEQLSGMYKFKVTHQHAEKHLSDYINVVV